MTDDATDGDGLKAADAKTLHRTVRESGEDELRRPAMQLFWSALAAGIAISVSLLTEAALHAALPDAPWRELVSGLHLVAAIHRPHHGCPHYGGDHDHEGQDAPQPHFQGLLLTHLLHPSRKTALG